MQILPIFVDTKALSETANLLIEKLSNGFGIIYEPNRIRREASAKADAVRIEAQGRADALLVHAEGQIAVSEIQRRAFIRFAKEQVRHQNNLENIEAKAVDVLETQVLPTNVLLKPATAPSEDFLENFVNSAKSVADEDIQFLWAKILAEEFTSPGSFSRQTINIVKSLEASDAQAFNTLACFVWDLDGTKKPLVFDSSDPVFVKAGIDTSLLVHLNSLGLIEYIVFGSQTWQYDGDTAGIPLSYQGRKFSIEPPLTSLETGRVALTRAGTELLRICTTTPIDGYPEYVAAELRSGQQLRVLESNEV